ncbi:S8 family serine peptidase [Streptomyces polyrhachis]|uniref:S8 family serine peptidase n=1 Tax=Streptomyces polyrhachis TaxID=1282885 RepID=A0ABW2GG13_9ACTN
MTHPGFGRRRLTAAAIGLALTATVGFLPGIAATATAANTNPAGKSAGQTLTYVVNTATDEATLARVRGAVTEAAGSVVITYEKIGVIVASSANPSFGDRMRRVPGVDSAGATRTAPLRPQSTTEVGGPQVVDAAKAAQAPAAEGMEPMEADQWDLRAIRADQAHRVSTGSQDVTVAVIDTGVDDTHPDLAANFSAAQSANCVGGVADTSAGAWRPDSAKNDYHGTHVAGEIAAARNGVGVAGVAPGVKVSSIRVSEKKTALFYPEAVVCAFVFAADHGVEITNNSYYIDPWLYNCLDDPDQRAIVDAVDRASRYAQSKGTLHLASAGNSNHDLDSDAILDDSSPDDSTAYPRTVDPHSCFDIPTQLPGVVTVSATGVHNLKSYYSSYGLGVVDVAAPGGDRYQIPDTPSANGRILSTMPGGEYGFLQGTSMASPHAAGVAALIKSSHPELSAEHLQAALEAQADDVACPEFYDPDGNGVQDSTCSGPAADNAFYGEGVVDALDAVTK